MGRCASIWRNVLAVVVVLHYMTLPIESGGGLDRFRILKDAGCAGDGVIAVQPVANDGYLVTVRCTGSPTPSPASP